MTEFLLTRDAAADDADAEAVWPLSRRRSSGSAFDVHVAHAPLMLMIKWHAASGAVRVHRVSEDSALRGVVHVGDELLAVGDTAFFDDRGRPLFTGELTFDAAVEAIGALSYPAVVRFRRTPPAEDPSVEQRFSRVLALLQGMLPLQRRTVDMGHVERETRTWLSAFYLDHEVMLAMAQLLESVRGAARGSALSAQRAERAKHALRAAGNWAFANFQGNDADQEILRGEELLRGGQRTHGLWLARRQAREAQCVRFDLAGAAYSFHLPLHRFASALVCTSAAAEAPATLHGLLHAGLSTCLGFEALHGALEEPAVVFGTLISGEIEQERAGELTAQRRRATYGMSAAEATRALVFMLTWHPLRLLALRTQIDAGMWRRSGNIMPGQLKLYYNPYWHDTGHDLDVAWYVENPEYRYISCAYLLTIGLPPPYNL